MNTDQNNINHSPTREPLPEGLTEDDVASPLAYLDESEEFELILQELKRLHRILRKDFGARKKIHLEPDWAKQRGISVYWGDLNRKAREAVAAAARRCSGDDRLLVGAEFSDLRSAHKFVQGVNAQMEVIKSSAA